MNAERDTPSGTAAGFTLLEAIVAIAIMGLALIPIVSFLSLSANQLTKVADANDRSFTTQAAMAMIDPVNPAEEPHGTLALNDRISIAWDSQEIVPELENPVVAGALPAFRVSFYKVHVTVSQADSGPWFDFDMRKVGYKTAASSEFPGSNAATDELSGANSDRNK